MVNVWTGALRPLAAAADALVRNAASELLAAARALRPRRPVLGPPDLAGLDDHLLRDLGFSRQDAVILGQTVEPEDMARRLHAVRGL